MLIRIFKRSSPWTWVFAAFFPVYTYLVLHTRALVQTIWSNDTFLIADAGARLLEGLVPHNDYFSPLGILAPALVAAGLWFSDLNLTGAYDAAEVCAAISAIYIFARGRRLGLTLPLAFLLGLLSLHFVASLRPLGLVSFCVSISGFYNRIGWVLLAALFLETWAALRYRAHTTHFVTAGAVLSLLIADKPNLFVAGIFLTAPLAFARGAGWDRWRACLSSFANVTLVWLIAGRISPQRLLADYLVVTTAMPFAQKIVTLQTVVLANAWDFAYAALPVAGLAAFAWIRGFKARAGRGLGLLVATLGAGVLSGVGSAAVTEFMLTPMVPLIAYVVWPRRLWWTEALILAMVIALSARTFWRDFESLKFQRAELARVNDPDLYQTVDSPRARGLYLRTWANQIGVGAMTKAAVERVIEPSPAAYAIQVSRALELVRAHAKPDQTLLTLMGEQSFTYLAGLRHAPGDFLFYQVGRVNTLDFPTDIPKLVAGADLILTPKHLDTFEFYGGEFYVRAAFQRFVVSQFSVIAENEFWALWEKPR